MKAPKPFDILKGGTVPLLVAFVGFVGGVIGSLVGPYLTAQHQTAKDITDRRVAVYKKHDLRLEFSPVLKLSRLW